MFKLIIVSSLALLGITGAIAETARPQRILACNLGALTPEQRTRHLSMTKRLLGQAERKALPDGFLFTIDREKVSVPELAEWVANESRCCPGVDFHVDLPAFGPLSLKIDGGPEVKEFLAAEMGLR